MKQNIKLFFASLLSNNACIDGARKKPWYAAILIFFFSIILSVVPTSVLELKKQGDKYFESTTYGLREALTEFSEELQKDEFEGKMKVIQIDKKKYLQADEGVLFQRHNAQNDGKVDFKFVYTSNDKLDLEIAACKEQNVSYFVFTSDTVYISILDPNNPDSASPKVTLGCANAYKKLSENAFKETYAQGENATETANKTWDNWKVVIRKLYNQTRLKVAGIQLGISSAINVGIGLIMGFMVWVLTRGKNNPYKLFTVWESFKIAFWAALTPAMLTCGFGFLFKNFATMLFPLLLGVRVMWLTMKSLRPDGSGYAAN